MKKIILLCLILIGAALFWIPRGPALPPGLTFAQITNPSSSSSLPTGLTFALPTLTISAAGSGNGAWALSGNTSGTATCTAPAIAGTSTNPVVCSNAFNLPLGTAAAPAINFVGFTNYGFFFDNSFGAAYSSNGATALGFYGAGISTLAANTFRWCATTIASCTQDTGLGRPAGGVVSADTSAIGNALGTFKATGFLTVPIAVASLPSAASNTGKMMSVSDSTTVSAEGQTCVGSSTNSALAFSNGVVWKCF